MRKLYRAPSLATYGSLRDLTAGVGGASPDVPGLDDNCFTATAFNTILNETVTQSCTTEPGTGTSLGSF